MAVLGFSVEGPWDKREEYFAGLPNGVGFDWAAELKAEEAAYEKLMEVSDKATEDSPKGFIMTFPVADGQACYLVAKLRPLTLRHIPFMDGYKIEDAYIRGINLDDVKKQIRWRDVWAKHKA